MGNLGPIKSRNLKIYFFGFTQENYTPVWEKSSSGASSEVDVEAESKDEEEKNLKDRRRWRNYTNVILVDEMGLSKIV
ncbi:unnamed protein product [Lactuca virosa]|uniref:Uncharacterized protein n=1 Tax=Lactuca virosa TaxID=75947 RepID=A0AAU9PCA4_9ASTR|nr:unnamed protein product [Lactuca virosa]